MAHVLRNCRITFWNSFFPKFLTKRIFNCGHLYNNIALLIINVAVNYGGRDEIINAVRQIITDGVKIEDLNEEAISDRLYTKGQPDPDFIIRPSGEYRLSNYLIWQSAYSEFWFANVLWPDFTPRDLERAIDDYNSRNRRFGGV